MALNVLNAVGIDPAQQSYLAALLKENTDYVARIQELREYAQGEQAAALTPEQKRLLGSNTNVSMNVCGTVIDAPMDRCKIRRMAAQMPDESEAPKGETTLSDEITKWMSEEWWNASRLDEESGNLHFASGRDGDTYLIVAFDNDENRPVFYLNQAWDGDSGVDVVYSNDNHNQPLWFTKRWTLDQPAGSTKPRIRRMNVYYENRVEKYIMGDVSANATYGSAFWKPYDGDEDTQLETLVDGNGRTYTAGVTWWTDDRTANGKPLGFPVIHFRCTPKGEKWGRSLLADVVPDMQDDLNLAKASIRAAMLLNGFKTTILFSDNDFEDSDGNSIEPELYPGALLQIPPSDGGNDSVTQLEETNLKQLIDVKDSCIFDIATITHTPLSYFNITGQIAAEGTLQAQEAPLLAKVGKLQTSFGNSWEDAFRMGLKLYAVFGQAPKVTLEQAEIITITCEWESAATRNEKIEAEIAEKHINMGIEPEIVWSKLGYTPAEIAKNLKIKKQREISNTINTLRTQQSDATSQLAQAQEEMMNLREGSNAVPAPNNVQLGNNGNARAAE